MAHTDHRTTHRADVSVWIGYAVLVVLGVWLGYSLVLSKASRDISRAMARGANEPGLQDAITPPILALSYYACFIAWIAGYSLQLYYFGVLHGILGLFAMSFGGAALAARFPGLVPNDNSPYWVRVMHRSLLSRAERYRRRGNQARADAMRMLATRMEHTFSEVLQPAEARLTK
jgi:hypothetical protein